MTDFDADIEEAVGIVTATEFSGDLDRMLPLVEALVAGWAQGRVRMESPEERRALAELHARLSAVVRQLNVATTAIEEVFRRHALATQARDLPLAGGQTVVYEAPKGSYHTDARAMRTALLAIAHTDGTITPEEVAGLFTEEVTVKVDHRKLNAIARKRGTAVAEAIDRHRVFRTPPPEQGKVRFPSMALTPAIPESTDG